MPLPPSIQTVTVSFGPFVDFEGTPLRGATTFDPSTPVRHDATGTPILNRPITVEWDADGLGVVVLPATDSVGLDRTGFTYRVSHRTYDNGVPAPLGGSIQLPAAAPTVDLDLLVPAVASNGVVVEQPALTAVAGLTGAPSAEQLVDAMDVPLRAAFGALEGDNEWTGVQDFTGATVTGVSAAVPDASTTVKGIVELATTGEATTGTDTARAVTPAGVKAVADALAAILNPDALTVGEATVPRGQAVGNTTLTSGSVRFVHFTARKTETITQVRLVGGATAAGATPTLVRAGIYSVAPNGDLTLLGATANDTTLFSSAFAIYTRALTSSVSKVAGNRYALGLLAVTSAAAPTIPSQGSPSTAELAQDPRMASVLTGQTDLPSSVTAGSLGASVGPYAVLLP